MPGGEVGCRLPDLSIGQGIKPTQSATRLDAWGQQPEKETGRRGQPRVASLGSSHLRGCWVCHQGCNPGGLGRLHGLFLNRHSFLSFPICKIAMLSGTRCCKLVSGPELLAHLSGQCGQGPSDAWGWKEALSSRLQTPLPGQQLVTQPSLLCSPALDF